MHEDIAAFPSQQFYEGKLITPNSIKDRPAPPWSTCPCFPPICFWDTNGHNVPDSSRGFRNNQEVEFITKAILSIFAETFLSRSDEVVSIGIISFYRDQVSSYLVMEIIGRINICPYKTMYHPFLSDSSGEASFGASREDSCIEEFNDEY